LLSCDALAERVGRSGNPPAALVAGGDVMLDGRARLPLAAYGSDYAFRSVRPLLNGVPIVLANHEGPLARAAALQPRRYAYRGDPRLAHAVRAGGITVVSLANNHLFDCGPEGVLETMQAVDEAGLQRVGAGRNMTEARLPVIQQTGPWRVGLLGYYWNRRCAATTRRPGGATGSLDELSEDIGRLRPLVDWLVVTFHWGIPYERQPLPEDREKARRAIEWGADLVFGHHPHVLQPYEVHHRRPIFYSLGNFAFGSGNSRAEGMLVRVSFAHDELACQLFPLYVRNRDPRVNYQPRVLAGPAAERVLVQLSDASRPLGPPLTIRDGVGHLRVPLEAGRQEPRLSIVSA
jgi:poly-gamma-glutamate capsule biosynthesis protein CapA/YwtB (metallophosphatase superfamily)